MFWTDASLRAQIAQQAATIRELTDKLAVTEGRYNAQSVHLRQVEGQRDAYHSCNLTLSARLARFTSARDRDPSGRFVKLGAPTPQNIGASVGEMA